LPSASDAADRRRELTWLGLALGAAITLVFTAANIYLGLKVGLTFASTIPAAVISMGVLRAFKNSTIYENNIVQTVASAAGTISAVIFVLPGLVMVGWWTGFPFWESFGICSIGGILGVMYSVPLRRALVTQSDLPYPEGVAAAEVLKVGVGTGSAADVDHNTSGLLALVVGSVASAAFAAIVATRIFVGEVAGYFRAGSADTGFAVSLSLALVGAGHLIGLSVGLAMLAGLVIAWGFATPILAIMHPAAGDAATVALAIWHEKVRFIGAGAIGVAALWSLGRLAKPVWGGVASAIAASRHRSAGLGSSLPRGERDIPIGIVALASLACLVPLGALLSAFLSGSVLASQTIPLIAGAIVYIVIVGFLVAAACGYMAGLIGSSNSPVSGLAILAIIGAALLLLALAHNASTATTSALVAFALFVTSILVCVATIANDNLQDLKTGQLVDATPWRQQVALIFGVVAGSLVIPPILDLLNHAYGFAGAPHVGAAAQPLAAPQATLVSALAKGVLQGQIDWGLIGAGALIGLAVVGIDELLRVTTRFRLPPLAVGLGIYLPAGTISAVVVGAVMGWFYNRWADRRGDAQKAKQLAVLVASGMIVGESLFGVLLAGLIVGGEHVAFVKDKANPLSLVSDAFAGSSTPLIVGGLAFAAVVLGLYRWTAHLSERAKI
jgi:putative OPT family oligopeptide transporter